MYHGEHRLWMVSFCKWHIEPLCVNEKVGGGSLGMMSCLCRSSVPVEFAIISWFLPGSISTDAFTKAVS